MDAKTPANIEIEGVNKGNDTSKDNVNNSESSMLN